MLLPVGPPLPPPVSDTYGIDLAACRVFYGFIAAGSPIGIDAVMLQFATGKSSLWQGKVTAIRSLCPGKPQIALGVIANSGNRGLDYLIRTTLTIPILSVLKLFDKHLADTTLDIICPKPLQTNYQLAKLILQEGCFNSHYATMY